ncbi:T9SS type A sorting domain-containing protein [uncultured Winogradskyella sp.]|uniref:T9SS type A sorting domain-containing protein n=1 Tax=uncultured Winogradskyella sp. TaxID=395353 RepID=UPI002620CC49|nr:T9SS type A sorting domain-containing protein [uncultured Winogradskyella sp.]
MRAPITCLLLGFVSLISAQLSVRNNAYIYVNDEIVFVKDDVNLNEADSKIYLRSDGQLIQGDGTTGNSGIGELSVYQDGTTNQWSYNYWCSPVGGILVNNFGNNAFRVNQTDDPLLATASPIDSQNSGFTNNFEGANSPLVISNRWLYAFVSSGSYSNWIFVGSTNDIAPGLGYTMKGIGTATTGNQTYDFRGKPNSGTIGNSVADGLFTLVGNPYPSAMDAAAYIHDVDNVNAIDGSLYYWEQDGTINSHVLRDYVGGYYTFTINVAGDVITDTPAVFNTYDEQDNTFALGTPQDGVKSAGRYIPIGQGFMVKGETGSTGTVFAKNSHRAYEIEGSNSFFFRSGNSTRRSDDTDIAYQDNGLSLVPEDYKRFRINVDFTVNEAEYTRQVVLNFHDSATAGFDRGLELVRASNYPSDVYFTLNNKSFSGLAYPFNETLIIPVIVDIEAQQTLRFRIFDIQNFEENQPIFIYDTETDTYNNLRDQNYELTIDPNNYTNRFKIVFAEATTLTLEDFAEDNALTIRQDNGAQELHVNNPNYLNVATIEIIDINGKRISKKLVKRTESKYKLSTANLSDGVYIVNIALNDATISEKILVKN